MKKHILIILSFVLFPFMVRGKWPEECSVIRGNNCYEFVGNFSNFNSAQDLCKIRGGDIMFIGDRAMSEFAVQLFKRYGPCSRAECRIWIRKPENYTNWASGQPDRRSSNAAYADHFCIAADFNDGSWHDESCSREFRRYVCEYQESFCSTEYLNIEHAEFTFCDEKTPTLKTPRTTIDVRCHPNFYLVDPSSRFITCKNGNWSKSPECKAGCPQPEIPPFSTLTNIQKTYFLNDEAIFLCDSGFVVENYPLRSHFSKTCGEYGQWTNSTTKCIPIKNKNIEPVAISEGKTLELECVINGYNAENSENERFLWQRDSHNILPSTQGVNIGEDGLLRIFDFSLNHAGVYSCFIIQPSFQIGTMSFDVRLKKDCADSPNYSNKEVFEGSSIILNCPHNSYTTVKWFKNGETFIENSKNILNQDGSLIFTEVDFEDKGTYMCLIEEYNSHCTQNITIDLRVIASGESICGRLNKLGSHPWTVSLWIEDEKIPFCYGTLFHERHVLTSAYCISTFYRKKILKMYVQFGENLMDLDRIPKGNNNNSSNKAIGVESLKIHPKYSRRLFANDIGILKLKERVKFTDTIQPICLSHDDFTIRPNCDFSSFIEGTVSGWGSLEIDDVHEEILVDEPMQLLSSEICQQADFLKFNENFFCAKNNQTVEANYAADIGSPFEYTHNNRVYLLGIYCVGERLSHTGEFDYFTKISRYVPWIQSYVKNA